MHPYRSLFNADPDHEWLGPFTEDDEIRGFAYSAVTRARQERGYTWQELIEKAGFGFRGKHAPSDEPVAHFYIESDIQMTSCQVELSLAKFVRPEYCAALTAQDCYFLGNDMSVRGRYFFVRVVWPGMNPERLFEGFWSALHKNPHSDFWSMVPRD